MAAAPLPKVSLTIRPLPPWRTRLVPNQAKTSFGTRQHAAAAATAWSQYAHGSVEYTAHVWWPSGRQSRVFDIEHESPLTTQLLLWVMGYATISQHKILTGVLAHSSLIFSDADAWASPPIHSSHTECFAWSTRRAVESPPSVLYVHQHLQTLTCLPQ